MRLDLFDYELPEELIADRPPEERDGARLLRLARGGGVEHRAVRDLARLLPARALVVVNDTRVLPARLFGAKPSGGKVELLLVDRLDAGAEDDDRRQRWRVLARASKPIREGATIAVGEALAARVVRARAGDDGTLEVVLEARAGDSVSAAIERAGHVPLPPYLKRSDDAEDRVRYQTVFARAPGAVAAPTAGLHLSERILEELAERGIEVARATLHVSLGTFAPVKVDDLDHHPMHAETYVVDEALADAVAAARAREAPVVAVGTTVVRSLESAADPERVGHVRPTRGRTQLLIQPGYRFRVVDALLTNFHLPRSTLLALVSAFAGRERVLAAYRAAVEARYRFFSYGDAMLLDHDPHAEPGS